MARHWWQVTMESGFNWSLDDNKCGLSVEVALSTTYRVSSQSIYKQKSGMLSHSHPKSTNFRTSLRMKHPCCKRRMSLPPLKHICTAVMLLLTTQVSPAHSLELTTDRKFVYNFFRYFPQVRNQLSDECVSVSNYFRNHSTDDWATKSRSFIKLFTLRFILKYSF